MERVQQRKRPIYSPPGPGVDIQGQPVIDPTSNVLLTLEMAIKRQDDLREQESTHVREIMDLRAEYDEKIRELEGQLRSQEAARIDAIRSVDVAAVGRAAEVSATQASTLASQVATAAEAMRNQVAAAAAAAQQALTTALEPIQTAINDLRKAQYEQQGQKSAHTEGKESNQWVVVVILGAVFSLVQIGLHFMGK
jgi:cobalamin biosynthesis Mg chelatase CobN